MTKKKWKRYMGKACLSGRVKWFGEEPRVGQERRRKRGRKTRSLHRSACASRGPPLVRAQSSGQVLRSYRCRWNPRARARAQSWIILPKGIFIGRECMQKRGHRHKGAAGLALTQLREVDSHMDSGPRRRIGQTPRNGLPNFPLLARSPALLLPSSFLCVDPFPSPPLADGASSLY